MTHPDLTALAQQAIHRWGLQPTLQALTEQLDDPALDWIEQILDLTGPDGTTRVLRHLDHQLARAVRHAATNAAAAATLAALIDTINQATAKYGPDHNRAWRHLLQSDQLHTARRLTQEPTT